jgi:hypothetical protein
LLLASFKNSKLRGSGVVAAVACDGFELAFTITYGTMGVFSAALAY